MSYTTLYPRYCCSSPRCVDAEVCHPKPKCCDTKCEKPKCCKEECCEKTKCDRPHPKPPCTLECGCGFYGLIPYYDDPQFDCLKNCSNIVREYMPSNGCPPKCSNTCLPPKCLPSKYPLKRRPIRGHLDERRLRISNCSSLDLEIAIVSEECIERYNGCISKPVRPTMRLCKCESKTLYINAPGCGCCQYILVFKDGCPLLRCPHLIQSNVNSISIYGDDCSCIKISDFHVSC